MVQAEEKLLSNYETVNEKFLSLFTLSDHHPACCTSAGEGAGNAVHFTGI